MRPPAKLGNISCFIVLKNSLKINESLLRRIMKKFRMKVRSPKRYEKYSSFRNSVGKVYLSLVMNLFNRQIIGYDIAPDFEQTRIMMKVAFDARKVAQDGSISMTWMLSMRLSSMPLFIATGISANLFSACSMAGLESYLMVECPIPRRRKGLFRESAFLGISL